LLNVKNKQTEVEQQLEAARVELAACSYMDNVSKWMDLFAKATKLAVQLADVNRELALLERKTSRAP
jgi:N-formylglutamate amidohydrolase